MAHRLARFCLVLALMVFAGGAAFAQSTQAPAPVSSAGTVNFVMKEQSPTHPEKIAIAWYKKVNSQPDFKQWAALSPFLDDAKDSDTQAIIDRETNRLSRLFSEFDADQPLVVHTNLNLNDYSTINGVLTLKEFSAATFFAFSIYGESIAIVPRDIKNFHEIPIPQKQMNEMLGKTMGSGVVAELLLKPVLSDASAPFMHDGIGYKLLLADIAEINFWSSSKTDPQLLWTWRADWYQPQNDQQLLDLKKGDAH